MAVIGHATHTLWYTNVVTGVELEQLPQLQGALHDQQAMFQVVFNNLKSGNAGPFDALPSGVVPKHRALCSVVYRCGIPEQHSSRRGVLAFVHVVRVVGACTCAPQGRPSHPSLRPRLPWRHCVVGSPLSGWRPVDSYGACVHVCVYVSMYLCISCCTCAFMYLWICVSM